MKQLTIFVITTMFAFVLAATPVFAGGATAKAGLAQAQQAASKWKADAVPVSISTLTGNMDGTASKWAYMFYSPKAKMSYTVDIKDGKIVDAVEVDAYLIDPVGKEFIDSSQAMEVAKKNGLKVKETPAMSLQMMGQATKSPAVVWNVVGYTPGDTAILIEARTGKFLSKQEIKELK